MANRTFEEELREIERVVRSLGGGAAAREILSELTIPLPLRTLQYRLKHLADAGRLRRESQGRRTTYRLSDAIGDAEEENDDVVPLSKAGREIRSCLRQPPSLRTPVGYDRAFLDSYQPGITAYLSAEESAQLAEVGKQNLAFQAAGTYARQILDRILVDLSWNSSRLEGSTYSLLDTRRLIEFGKEPDGGLRQEAQLILNHKDAIEFLVTEACEVDYNRYTILNLHALLASNLLPDQASAGRLRHMVVGIEGSQPPATPQLECFDTILSKAAIIEDPFEQAFFVMVHLPYLQPFDDVNKRVSRLAANIPFIKRNLTPLSFVDVPRPLYMDAVLGVYELNRTELLKDVFLWAYRRSASRYAAIRQSLGEPDPFRLQYRDALRRVVGEVVREGMNRTAAFAHIAFWAMENLPSSDRERFREVVESELLGLHDGNFARYRIRLSEFAAWQECWNGGGRDKLHQGYRMP